ncbi:hypothetical protein [Bradyrhizobium lablabi]|uniref:hypothetical protein n=1 Tax=Bradyrhizobium lablabi TaxID=722472 RepID=UPI001BAE2835|nr:hypothetical protein [Bradyrhizobium lablabi]MBR0693607.1 hypothetical protein [Bradyrhizobium lablabi]
MTNDIEILKPVGGRDSLAGPDNRTHARAESPTGPLFRRPSYAPSTTNKLSAAILAALTDEWVNTAKVCRCVRRPSDDGSVRSVLKVLTKRGTIERKTVPNHRSRTGYAFLYRRKS